MTENHGVGSSILPLGTTLTQCHQDKWLWTRIHISLWVAHGWHRDSTGTGCPIAPNAVSESKWSGTIMSYPTQDGVRFFTHSGRSWPSSDVYTRTLPDAHGAAAAKVVAPVHDVSPPPWVYPVTWSPEVGHGSPAGVAGCGQSAHSRRDPAGRSLSRSRSAGRFRPRCGGPSDPRSSKPMIAGQNPAWRANSFQDTSYEYLTPGRPKSRNIAVLSPHSPVIGPHAPPDRAVVIIGFADRGSAGSHAL